VFCGREIAEGQRQCAECYGMQWFSDKISCAFGTPADLMPVQQSTLCTTYKGEQLVTGDRNDEPSLLES